MAVMPGLKLLHADISRTGFQRLVNPSMKEEKKPCNLTELQEIRLYRILDERQLFRDS